MAWRAMAFSSVKTEEAAAAASTTHRHTRTMVACRDLISSFFFIIFLSLPYSCLCYRPGDFVPMSLQTQYHAMRSPWHDTLGHHCPRFGIDREVLLPLSQPTGYTGADPYKITLQIGKEKFHTPWLFVIGRQTAEVPMVIIKLIFFYFHNAYPIICFSSEEIIARYAGADLQGVVAKIENMPHQYLKQHEDVMKHYWDVKKWPKHILIQYQWEERSIVDVETGLYILFGSGFTLTLVMALHILQSSKEKLARFVKETMVSSSLQGEEAKVE